MEITLQLGLVLTMEMEKFKRECEEIIDNKFISSLKSKKDLFITTLHEEGKLVELFNKL